MHVVGLLVCCLSCRLLMLLVLLLYVPIFRLPSGRVLILFSGRRRPRSLRHALGPLGASVVTFEVRDDPEGQDLSRAAVQEALLSRVRG